MSVVRPKLIDMHSHWGTERGWLGNPMKTPEQQKAMGKYFRWDHTFVTEGEQTAYFRANNVQVMLDLAWTGYMSVEQVYEQHEYAFAYTRQNPDVVLGNWLHIDPLAPGHMEEFVRCVNDHPGFLGIGISGNEIPSDEKWIKIYEICIEANIPVMMPVGMSAGGVGVPGGLGKILDNRHPRHVDRVAATYADLKILAARPAWPWQSEMIAVLLHKGNVWCELHGWAPKYHPPELKYEIARRLKDKIMFAADYPMLKYERLIDEWQSEGYSEDVLEKVFHENATAFVDTVGQ